MLANYYDFFLLVLLFDFSGISAVDYAEAEKQLNATMIPVLQKVLGTNKQCLDIPLQSLRSAMTVPRRFTTCRYAADLILVPKGLN
jgi:hypothetical protein